MQTSSSRAAGPLLALAAAVLFSFGGVIVKFLPWQSLSINGFRNLGAFFITLVYMRSQHVKFVFSPAVALGGLAMSFTTTGFCLGNKLTTAANAILLQYTSPVFIILFLWLIWRKRPSRRDVLMCCAVFLGIGCFFADSLSGGHLLGDALSLASGVTYSLVFIAGQMKGGDSISSFLLGEAVSALVGLPFLARETVFTPTTLLAGLALCCILGFGYVLMSLALRRVSPVTANLIGTAEPVLNPTWVALAFGERMTPMAFAGFAIVLGAVLAYNFAAARAVPVPANE